MRIIAGSARRLPLKTVSGMDIRPTTDRIKETLFNILSPRLPGCHFLDLFAGSGQIGLEAASRGASKVVFVESSRKAAACIEGNIKSTGLTETCELVRNDAVSAIRRMEGAESFGIVFMDPPYGKGLERAALAALSDSSLLEEGALVVAEAALGEDFSFAPGLGFLVAREKKYKTNKHVFLEREGNGEESDLSG